MKTKLDELLSNYLRKDKNASKTLSASVLTAENNYKVEGAFSTKPERDASKIFKSSKMKLWNFESQKDKTAQAKKEKIEFPEFLEFALKENEKQKNKKEGTSIGIGKKTEESKESRKHTKKGKKTIQLGKAAKMKTLAVSSKNEIEQQEQVIKSEMDLNSKDFSNTAALQSSTTKKTASNKIKKTMANKKSKSQKNVWALKERTERQQSILELLSEVKEITLLDMCKKHHARIGIRWPESGKWNENPWKVIRNDCRELAKEKKIIMYKDEHGKTYLKAYDENELPLVEKQGMLYTPGISAPTSFIRDASTVVASSAVDEVKQSIDKLEKEIQKVTGEILEIWKTLAQLQIKRR